MQLFGYTGPETFENNGYGILGNIVSSAVMCRGAEGVVRRRGGHQYS